jgi:hypothetical protein
MAAPRNLRQGSPKPRHCRQHARLGVKFQSAERHSAWRLVRAKTDQLAQCALRVSDMASFAAVIRVAGAIDAETSIVGRELLDVDHALLDDLGAVGLGRFGLFF